MAAPRRRRRRSARTRTTLVLILVTLVLLSFIGQTYGAASALLAVLALIGVVVTLVLQARETRTARQEARRTAIGDLLKMAMDDPELDECWGPVPAEEDPRTRRQMMYVNMIISEWQMSFETKALGEMRLRAIAGEMFQGRIGRAFWESARQIRIATSQTRRARRFHQIPDQEYRRAPAPPPENSPAGHRTRRPAVAGALVAGTPAAVSLTRRLLTRRRRQGDRG
jgi:hypothetical protein